MSQRVLKGAAYDVAHHAASGLSYLSPHLAEAIRTSRAEGTRIDLTSQQPYPDSVPESPPLRAALAELHITAFTIIGKHGFGPADVTRLWLDVEVPSDDNYLIRTRVTIAAADGREYVSAWVN